MAKIIFNTKTSYPWGASQTESFSVSGYVLCPSQCVRYHSLQFKRGFSCHIKLKSKLAENDSLACMAQAIVTLMENVEKVNLPPNSPRLLCIWGHTPVPPYAKDLGYIQYGGQL